MPWHARKVPLVDAELCDTPGVREVRGSVPHTQVVHEPLRVVSREMGMTGVESNTSKQKKQEGECGVASVKEKKK